VARNDTAIQTPGQQSSAQPPRQQELAIPAQRADGHPGGRGLAHVARGPVAVVEVAHRGTFPVLGLPFLRAWTYLHFVIQQARNPRWAAASCGAHARNLPAVRSRRHQKCWPRCSSPGCDRPVPPDAVHELCGRAGPYVALIRAPRHGGPCCPGTCPGCRACLDTPRVEAGWCARCGVCVLCCRGHDVVTRPPIRDSVPVPGNLHHPRRPHGHRQAHGKLRRKQPELPDSAQPFLRRRYITDEESLADPTKQDNLGRITIHRVIHHTHPDQLTPLSIPPWPDPPRPQS
jgi:hypothetical protein